MYHRGVKQNFEAPKELLDTIFDGMPKSIFTLWRAEQRGDKILSVQIPQSSDPRDVSSCLC